MTERNVQSRTYRLVYKTWPMLPNGRREGPMRAGNGWDLVYPQRVIESTVLDAYDDQEAIRRLEYRLIQEGCVYAGHGDRQFAVYDLIDVAPA